MGVHVADLVGPHPAVGERGGDGGRRGLAGWQWRGEVVRVGRGTESDDLAEDAGTTGLCTIPALQREHC